MLPHRLADQLPHQDLTTPSQMHADATATVRRLGLERQLAQAARAAVEPAPSITFEDYPREINKRDIRISDAATRLANALELHLD